MGHLGNSTPITTVQDKEIVLTGSDGHTFKMKIADLAEAVRQVMPVATAEKDGLLNSILFDSIKNHATKESNGNGVCLAQGYGRPTLVIAYDLAFFSRNIIYVYWVNRQRTSSQIVILSKSGDVGIKDSNNSGTIVIDGIANENVAQYAFYL